VKLILAKMRNAWPLVRKSRLSRQIVENSRLTQRLREEENKAAYFEYRFQEAARGIQWPQLEFRMSLQPVCCDPMHALTVEVKPMYVSKTFPWNARVDDIHQAAALLEEAAWLGVQTKIRESIRHQLVEQLAKITGVSYGTQNDSAEQNRHVEP